MNLYSKIARMGFFSGVICLAVAGCDHPAEHGKNKATSDGKSDSGIAVDLPAADFKVLRDMKTALFTWVSEDGSHNITSDATEIPEPSRKRVRVVVEGHSPGSADYVFVVNLADSPSTNEVEVHTLPRSEWEAMGKAARDKKVAELAPKPSPAEVSALDPNLDAVVYGAEWCKPCHLAEAYLKKKGAKVVKKDIEEDPQAAAEMRRKLKSVGLNHKSIPVLDVKGTILRGFSTRAIDKALAKASPKSSSNH